MTAAIVGVFLLIQFDAGFGWYIAVIGYAALELYQQEMRFKQIHRMLRQARIDAYNQQHPDDPITDED